VRESLKRLGTTGAGLFAIAIRLSQAAALLSRAFWLAWAPIAYSTRDGERARRLYARALTYFLLAGSTVALATSLAAPWIVRALAAATYAIGVVATSESGAASLLLRGILIPLYLIALWPAGFFVRGELRGWRGFFARVRLAHP
jgi:hypothetical protein